MTVKDIRNLVINLHIEIYEMFGGLICETTNDEPTCIADERRVVYIQGCEDNVLEITVC